MTTTIRHRKYWLLLDGSKRMTDDCWYYNRYIDVLKQHTFMRDNVGGPILGAEVVVAYMPIGVAVPLQGLPVMSVIGLNTTDGVIDKEDFENFHVEGVNVPKWYGKSSLNGMLEPMGQDRLVLLKRNHPTIFEVHLNEIDQSKNLLFTLKDQRLASDIVERYNAGVEPKWQFMPDKIIKCPEGMPDIMTGKWVKNEL